MRKKNNTPRHKRLNREGRLQVAEHWLLKFNGKNIVRGYSKYFGVDLLAAVRELEVLGMKIDDKYKKQLEEDLQNKLRRKEMIKQKKLLESQDKISFDFEYTEEFDFQEEIELPF